MSEVLIDRDTAREVDRLASEKYGLAGIVLMENAGRGVVDFLEEMRLGGPVTILCGAGNNAGDGFVVARHLEIRGHDCRVLSVVDPEKLSGDALTNFQVLKQCGVQIVDVASAATEPVALQAWLNANGGGAQWIVDAMLGTGARGAPRSPMDQVIEWANAQPARRLAIDVPSGLDCDTGEAATPTFRATYTCTFVAGKQGFAIDRAREFTGEVRVLSIGTPPQLLRELVP